MKEEFAKFSEKIRLTESQEADAKTKYRDVCETLHKSYYKNEYDGKTKLLFGSYRTKTNTRPLSEKQDVDVIFKIPEDTYNKFKKYEKNGPSALLQEIKDLLKKKYTTTDKIKGWGKVVLVEFANNTHNVEVLPAFELENKTFKIPNSENGGSWDSFDPRQQVDAFHMSNSTTNTLTADLTRMMKAWVKNTPSLDYKSYTLLNDVMGFLKKNYENGADYSDYHLVIKGCFKYLKENCESSLDTHLKSAVDRAEKAVGYIDENKPKEASMELIKIFGAEFPSVTKNPVSENRSKTRVFTTPSSPYASFKIK
jgi:hypothetical protein